jgi:hypothetical protein
VPVPPFETGGDLLEGLHQADLAESFRRFGRGTAQRERVAVQLRQAFELVRPFQIVARVAVWGSFVTAKPAPADADILWVTRPTFDRSQLPVQVEVLFDGAIQFSFLSPFRKGGWGDFGTPRAGKSPLAPLCKGGEWNIPPKTE